MASNALRITCFIMCDPVRILIVHTNPRKLQDISQSEFKIVGNKIARNSDLVWRLKKLRLFGWRAISTQKSWKHDAFPELIWVFMYFLKNASDSSAKKTSDSNINSNKEFTQIWSNYSCAWARELWRTNVVFRCLNSDVLIDRNFK